MNQFSRKNFDALPEDERIVLLNELNILLSSRLPNDLDRREFFTESSKIISDLKSHGHDIWSWGYDGEATELWGGDYMHPEEMGQLKVEFTYPGQVRVFWGDIEDDCEE